MNKNLIIAIAAVVLIILGVAGYMVLGKSKTPSMQSENSSSDNQMMDMFTDAFGGSGSIKCTYSDETSQGTAYIKNGMVKVESQGTDNKQYGNVIMKNDTVWTWETGGTQGMMIENISQYMADPNAPDSSKVDVNKIKDQITQNKPNCSQENIDDSTFNPPANVTFQNMSQMMQNAMPSGVDQTQVEELMKQYTTPTQ